MKHHPIISRLPLMTVLATALLSGAEVDSERLNRAEEEPANWLTYYGGYKSWRYSPAGRNQSLQRQEPAACVGL